ncbi:MAG: STN domain-containing protein [Phycisphaerae bacterium]|nr:STN domain-containing protein [Phycisphaerae bacterium]
MNTSRMLVLLLASSSALGQIGSSGDAGERGTNLSAAIEQVLDQKTELTIRDENILVAFDELTQKTGVPLRIDQTTLDRLPYGEQTQLNAEIKNATLREALAALLRPLGLRFEVREGAVHVEATPPLARLVRRATWDELDLLRQLTESPWSDELWASLPVQFRGAGGDETVNREMLGTLARNVGAGSAAEVLEQACAQRGWTWFPSDKKVVVLSDAEQVRRQLDRRITLKFFHAPLMDVLMTLGREAGLLVRMDPGVIASVPSQIARQFTLQIEHMSIRQALEAVAGATGLGYSVEGDGIRITANPFSPEHAGSTAGQTAATAAQTNPVIAMVTIKGEDGAPDMTFFIRENDVPEELRGFRQQKVDEAIERIRNALKTE